MKPKLNLDDPAYVQLIDDISQLVINQRCRHATEKAVIEAVKSSLGSVWKKHLHDELERSLRGTGSGQPAGILAKRPRRRIDFNEYYRFLAGHEAKFMRGLKSIWAGERRQMIANMKRTPKSAMNVSRELQIKFIRSDFVDSIPPGVEGYSPLTYGKLVESYYEAKDSPAFNSLFDQWLYPQGPAKRELEKAYKDVATKLIQQAGKREATKYDLSIDWDVFNPNVDKWLKGYAPKYSGEIEGTSYDELKAKLLEGWEAGESIPDLTKRVNEIFDGWEKWRAERLARTESIRGSNQGALETYRTSGVVDRVMWLATPTEKTCEQCMGLDGKVVELGEDFFDADYGDGNAPPVHPNCRCTVLPILEGEEV